jgi:hypothetical protein
MRTKKNTRHDVRASDRHFGVAPRAATVLWRTAAADFNQARIERTKRRVGEAFDFDCVLPAIAEVIDIDELLRADILGCR